jgi:hypothetical protein
VTASFPCAGVASTFAGNAVFTCAATARHSAKGALVSPAKRRSAFANARRTTDFD